MASKYKGYAGRILDVDLTTGKILLLTPKEWKWPGTNPGERSVMVWAMRRQTAVPAISMAVI